jgi:hypothetical protein
MGDFLVCRLRAGRHGVLVARLWTSGAVADRQNVGVTGGLQSRLDDELADAVHLVMYLLVDQAMRSKML